MLVLPQQLEPVYQQVRVSMDDDRREDSFHTDESLIINLKTTMIDARPDISA